MKAESFAHAVAGSALWKTLERVAALAKHVFIAGAIGLTLELDVYYLAIALLGLLVFSWGGFFDIVAVPNLVRRARENNWAAFTRLAGGGFWLAVAMGAFLGSFLLLGKDLVATIAVGFDPDGRAKLASALVWLVPIALGYCAYRQLGAILRARRLFSAFYRSEFLAALVSLVCIAALSNVRDVLFWSVTAGFLASFVFLRALTPLSWTPFENPLNPEVRGVLQIAPALMVFQISNYGYQLTDRFFMTWLPAGSISAIAYGWTIAALLPSVLALQGPFLTVFAEASDDQVKSSQVVEKLMLLSILGAICASSYLVFYGQRFVSVLLERGLFTSSDSYLVGLALLGFAPAIFPSLMMPALDQVFIVKKRLRTMVGRLLVGLSVNATLDYFAIFVLDFGVLGVAAATTISYFVMVGWQMAGLRKIGIRVRFYRQAWWLARLVAVAGISILLSISVPRFLGDPFALILQTFVFLAVFVACLLLFRGEEGKLLRTTFARARNSLTRR